MLPVLFSIGNLAVSSLGIFLALGLLYAVFLVWRLARSWDLDEEKILDLTLLTFLGGVIGARIYFAIDHSPFFLQSPFRFFLITKYPGFSFWGAFLGGWLTLYLFSRRFKIDFWQVADIGIVGFLGGLILADIGCFLGGCSVGIPSKSFLAAPMVGVIGKRLPVQLFEAILLTLALSKLWSGAKHFHFRGKIVSLALIYIGVVKLAMEPLREGPSGYFNSLILVLLGITIFYRVTGRNVMVDLRSLAKFSQRLITDKKTQALIIDQLQKSWYNQKIAILWKLRIFKKLLRRMNVRFSFKNS